MAVLTNEQRQEVADEFMALISRKRQPFGAVAKADIRAAVNALDGWYNANAAAINSALPEPFKTEASTPHKAHMNNLLLTKRYITGA